MPDIYRKLTGDFVNVSPRCCFCFFLSCFNYFHAHLAIDMTPAT